MSTDLNAQLREYLIALDQYLTGKDRKTCEHTYKNNNIDCTEGYSTPTDLYYLSDSGYSRVVLNIFSDNIQLAQGAREPVLFRWDNRVCDNFQIGLKKLFLKIRLELED